MEMSGPHYPGRWPRDAPEAWPRRAPHFILGSFKAYTAEQQDDRARNEAFASGRSDDRARPVNDASQEVGAGAAAGSGQEATAEGSEDHKGGTMMHVFRPSIPSAMRRRCRP